MLLPQADLVNTPIDNIQWMAVLKSASAFEMFRKAIISITPRNVADFLIFDSQFPRSIRHCITKAMICLHRISGSAPGSVHNAAEKRLGRLDADLDYTDIDEVIDQRHARVYGRVANPSQQVDEAIGTTFFNLQTLIEAAAQQQ